MNIALKINRPDEIIPFTEIIAHIPSFRCKRPQICESAYVGTSNDNLDFSYVEITVNTENVVCVDDLKELIHQLDRYAKYLQYQSDLRTPENVLKTLLTTKKGRKFIEDMLSNANFNAKSHGKGNGEINWPKHK